MHRRFAPIDHMSSVMAGLFPAIHAVVFGTAAKTWMSATSAGMTAQSV